MRRNGGKIYPFHRKVTYYKNVEKFEKYVKKVKQRN